MLAILTFLRWRFDFRTHLAMHREMKWAFKFCTESRFFHPRIRMNLVQPSNGWWWIDRSKKTNSFSLTSLCDIDMRSNSSYLKHQTFIHLTFIIGIILCKQLESPPELVCVGLATKLCYNPALVLIHNYLIWNFSQLSKKIIHVMSHYENCGQKDFLK